MISLVIGVILAVALAALGCGGSSSAEDRACRSLRDAIQAREARADDSFDRSLAEAVAAGRESDDEDLRVAAMTIELSAISGGIDAVEIGVEAMAQRCDELAEQSDSRAARPSR